MYSLLLCKNAFQQFGLEYKECMEKGVCFSRNTFRFCCPLTTGFRFLFFSHEDRPFFISSSSSSLCSQSSLLSLRGARQFQSRGLAFLGDGVRVVGQMPVRAFTCHEGYSVDTPFLDTMELFSKHKPCSFYFPSVLSSPMLPPLRCCQMSIIFFSTNNLLGVHDRSTCK